MKRTMNRPIILTLRSPESFASSAPPRILPFPGRATSEPPEPVAADPDPDQADLDEVRDRLFRMIVANQWDRSHGNRAS